MHPIQPNSYPTGLCESKEPPHDFGSESQGKELPQELYGCLWLKLFNTYVGRVQEVLVTKGVARFRRLSKHRKHPPLKPTEREQIPKADDYELPEETEDQTEY